MTFGINLGKQGSSSRSSSSGSSFGYNQSGSSSMSDSSSSGRSFIDPEQQQYLSDLYRKAMGLTGGSTFAGFDPLQTQSHEMAISAADKMGGILNDATGANRFLLGDVMNPESNPYLSGYANAAINPLKQSLMRDILPQIGMDAAANNAFSSSRKGVAQGNAISDFMNKAGDITSGIYSNAYGQNLDAMQQAIARSPELASASLMPSNTIGAVGEQRRTLEQEQLMDPILQLQRAAGIIGGPTVLSEQKSDAISRAIAEAMGINTSQNQSTSKGGSYGWNSGLNFG